MKSIKTYIAEKTGLNDKVLHFIGGALISGIATIWLYAGWGAVIGIAIGLLVEIYDHVTEKRFSFPDFFITALGASVGATITEILKTWL